MKLILLVIAILIAYRIIRGFMPPPGARGGSAQEPPERGVNDLGEETVYDAVCSSYVPVSKAVTADDERSRTRYFCSEECMQTFLLHRDEGKDGGEKDRGEGYPFF